MQNNYQILLDEVRQNFASVVWTHKVQEKQADIYAKHYKRLETANIIAAAPTSCGIVSVIFCNELTTKIIAAICSFVTLAISAYYKSFDLRSMENRHRIAANKFIVIRNQLLHVIAELRMQKDIDTITIEYEKIMKDLNDEFERAPSTTDEAVGKAAEALNVKNEYTYTDEEIDHFLPSNLRGGIQ